jgi:glyoxylase-like metal-dependent hydrolase (beta-lactamase superfamily II)
MPRTTTARFIAAAGAWTRAAAGIAAALCSLGAAASVPARPPTPPGWFHIIPIDAHTYAISEPKYWQENVSYLLIGSRRALLFDTGPGIYSIRGAVASLTSLPVVVIPSHLHFDHVGDLEEFDDVRLLDTPALRAQVHDGYFVEPPSQYLLRTPIRYRVHGWIKDGQTIALGGRTVRLLSTPGHTPDSVSVIDAGGVRMFTGDIVNRVITLCDVPGSDVKAMAASLERLLKSGRPGSPAYEAHSESPLTRPELEQLAGGIRAIAAGTAVSTPMCLGGTPTRRFTVGAFAVVLPVSDDATLKPLGSVTETLDWEGGECKPLKRTQQ